MVEERKHQPWRGNQLQSDRTGLIRPQETNGGALKPLSLHMLVKELWDSEDTGTTSRPLSDYISPVTMESLISQTMGDRQAFKSSRQGGGLVS